MNPDDNLQSLFGKHILLGITGGIAAYKSAELTRRLRDAGAEVQVVMTRAATEFVTPLTFQALSGNPVHTELLDEQAEAGMGHIQLARWADAILIAPASANTIARLAQGRGDDLLTAVCLASEAPLAFAPSMNQAMWHDAATQNNCDILRQRGYQQFGPAHGEQACGEVGEGRMLEVEQLVAATAALFHSGSLQAVKLLITAGPTFEAIDPVRFISNRSSGRMGFELARAAQEAGAAVTLVAGPVHLDTPPGVHRIDVESAHDMYQAVMQHLPGQQIFIGTAAVSDYRPQNTQPHKIKKHADTLTLHLVRNADIVAEVAAARPRPFVVGFAAETDELEHYARDKLGRKKLDMIAANRVGATEHGHQLGFNSDYNALHVFWHGGEQQIAVARKRSVARQLIHLIAHRYRLNLGSEPSRDSA